MRFMVMIKATPQTEAGQMPGEDVLAAMGRYNEELANAGVLLGGEGLQPSSKGARVRFGADGQSGAKLAITLVGEDAAAHRRRVRPGAGGLVDGGALPQTRAFRAGERRPRGGWVRRPRPRLLGAAHRPVRR